MVRRRRAPVKREQVQPRSAPPPRKKARPGAPRPIGPWLASAALLQNTPPAKIVLFDVGAHLGNVTAQMLRIWDRAHVYCFEPAPNGLARLHQRFDKDPRVTIVPSALGSEVGTATLNVCGQNEEMSSLLPRPEHGRRYYRHAVQNTIEVPVTTVDAFREEHGISLVHFMKVDVQGGESAIFSGARTSLEQERIHLLYSEVLFVHIYEGAAMFWQLCQQLAGHRYELFDIYNLQRSWINRQLKYGDAMWVSPTIRRRRLDRYPPDWLGSSLEQRMCPDY